MLLGDSYRTLEFIIGAFRVARTTTSSNRTSRPARLVRVREWCSAVPTSQWAGSIPLVMRAAVTETSAGG
jgi:hypothetical protein